MTQNDGGTPYEPEPDPGTQPTQPLPEPARGAEEPPASGTPQEPASGAPYGQPGAPGAYGQPAAPAVSQHGYAQSPPKNDLAVWSLITGILSYVFCPLVLGIAAIITGTMSRKAADQGLANNRGMGTAGLILGWINVALVLVGVVLFIVLLAAGLLSGGFGEWGDMKDIERYSDY